MSEQFTPAASTCVAGGDDRDRQWPIDRKVWVVKGDGQVLGGIVGSIDPIAHIGSHRLRLEAVQEARWNVQMPKVDVVKQKCLLLAERRRVLPDVDKYVVHGSVGAADELGLPSPRASVHSADNSLAGTRLGVLHERRRDPRLAESVVENVCVEGPRKQPSVVPERLRDEHENIGEVRLFNPHGVMLP